MQLNRVYLFLWRNARWRHWKCGYTQLEAATINHLHAPVTALTFGCSGAQIYDPEVMDEGLGQPRDNDRASPHDLVFYLGLEPIKITKHRTDNIDNMS